MSRLELSISHQVLWHTGDLVLWADIELLLKDNSGGWQSETFRVDTGSQVTTMSAYEAKHLGLPMPTNVTAGAVRKPTGFAIRSGFLRFRVAGMDQAEYAISCFFLGDPNTPPDPRQPTVFPVKLLQPFQLLDWLRFTLDRDPSIGAPYGTVTIEKKVP